MRLPVMIMLALLAACASTPSGDIDTARTSWQGATYDEVVDIWGTPQRSTKLSDGRDVYTWVSESVAQSRAAIFPSIGIFGGSGGGGGVSTGVGLGIGGGGYGGELVRCERTLIFNNARVSEQTWQGPADYCASFRRG